MIILNIKISRLESEIIGHFSWIFEENLQISVIFEEIEIS